MLVDPDGLVPNRLSGDTSLLRALDDVHLAPGSRMSGSHRRLTRIEAFERDEIVPCLSMPGATVTSAAG